MDSMSDGNGRACGPDFCDLPKSQREKHGKWIAIKAALDARPGDWAVVLRGGTSNSANSRSASLKKEGYEAVTRNVDGEMRVYARKPIAKAEGRGGA